MQCYERLGRITDALALYDQFCLILSSQLKTQPGAELQALHRQLSESVNGLNRVC